MIKPEFEIIKLDRMNYQTSTCRQDCSVRDCNRDCSGVCWYDCEIECTGYCEGTDCKYD